MKISEFVFPAPAGVIPSDSCNSSIITGFPRTCGGDPRRVQIVETGDVFSPHLRG